MNVNTEIRAEVTMPDGRHIVTHTPVAALACTYPAQTGHRLAEVEGYDHPDGYGFVVQRRHYLPEQDAT